MWFRPRFKLTQSMGNLGYCSAHWFCKDQLQNLDPDPSSGTFRFGVLVLLGPQYVLEAMFVIEQARWDLVLYFLSTWTVKRPFAIVLLKGILILAFFLPFLASEKLKSICSCNYFRYICNMCCMWKRKAKDTFLNIHKKIKDTAVTNKHETLNAWKLTVVWKHSDKFFSFFSFIFLKCDFCYFNWTSQSYFTESLGNVI